MGKDWTESGLDPVLQKTMTGEFGFTSMTPVQAAAIPLFTQHKDVCVEACTGSGKTLTYLLPIFHRILHLPGPIHTLFALIIAPSRELAHQIHSITQKITSILYPSRPPSIYCMTGGTSIPDEIEKINSDPPVILIATPGRLSDMLNKVENWSLRDLEVLVLDEADRLLDMGFKETVQGIVSQLPKQRRTGLFSATMSTEVRDLVKAGLRNPAFITVKTKSKVTPLGLTNYYLLTENSTQKTPLLIQFLLKYAQSKTIVFFGTCDSTDYFHYVLSNLPNFPPIFHIHGKMPQRKREKVYSSFESAEFGVLLTTDLIARGIDFPNIDWIVQFDPPKSPDSFIHRIGRTARAGKTGQTVIFLRTHEENYIDFLRNREVKVELMEGIEEQTESWEREIDEIVTSDRDVYECAQRAFVSYIRYYEEQELSFLFRLKDLDIGNLAHSFHLLRLPRINEILGKSITSFTNSDRNPEDITYRDTAKEAKRQEELRQKVLLKEQRLKEKNKEKERKKSRSRSEKRHTRRSNSAKELDSLRHEENMVRKIKKGKVNSEEVKQFLEEFPNIKAIFRRKKH